MGFRAALGWLLFRGLGTITSYFKESFKEKKYVLHKGLFLKINNEENSVWLSVELLSKTEPLVELNLLLLLNWEKLESLFKMGEIVLKF